jgi:hypothetical protein
VPSSRPVAAPVLSPYVNSVVKYALENAGSQKAVSGSDPP